MKRRMLLLALVGVMAISTPICSCAAEAQSETEGTLQPITSGDLYDKVYQIDSNFEIYQSSDGSLSFNYLQDNIDRQFVIDYFWKIVQILDLEMNKSQDSFSFMLLGKKNDKSYMSSLSISNFEGITSDFMSYHLLVAEDDETKVLLNDFYNTYFGAHSSDNGISKIAHDYDPVKNPLPENYRNGFLWVLSNFKVGSGYSINDSKITVTESVPNTKEGGIAAYITTYASLPSYDAFRNQDSEAMPYNTIDIIHCDEDNTSNILWDFTVSNETGQWKASYTAPSGDFAQGIEAGKIVWDSGSVNRS